jgi:serine/threonine protein kinase
MAPELFSENIEHFNGFAADIYSLGATLFTLITGSPPYMADTEMELVEKQRTQPLQFTR